MTKQATYLLLSLIVGLVFVVITVAILYWPDRILSHFRPAPSVIKKNTVVAPTKLPPVIAEPTNPAFPPYSGDSSIGVQAGLGDVYLKQHAYAPAARHYLRAAVCGDAHSQDELAKLYELGHGVKKDYKKAWLWIRIAYEVGRTEESIENRMMSYWNQIPIDRRGEVEEAFELWAIRRPDQTLTCQTVEKVVEPLFDQGLFRLN